MQQGVQMDTTDNIQQCCVHLHGALQLYFYHVFVEARVKTVDVWTEIL